MQVESVIGRGMLAGAWVDGAAAPAKRSGLEREAWECPGGKKTVGFCVVTWRTGGWGRGGSGGLRSAEAPEPDWTGGGLALGGPFQNVRRSFNVS